MITQLIVRYVRPLFRNNVYVVRQGLIKGMKRKGGFGFISYEKKSSENRYLQGLNLNGKIVFDIGGWEGVFALFFSRSVGKDGKVIVFEPNPENFQIISDNVSLNDLANVALNQVAVGSDSGVAQLMLNESLSSGRGTIQPSIHDKSEMNVVTHDVQMVTVDAYVESTDILPDFVKIDVEGFEWEVLKGMEKVIDSTHPQMFIELHDGYLPPNEHCCQKIVDFLLEKKYKVKHLEDGSEFTALSNNYPKLGHLVCVYADNQPK